ncbi:MAG: hypothetical protein Q8M31_14780 [Beijerinckiaceae bacterium]|nr:hypothetical protein [Beijerinckiaceae bacterium]
MADRKAETNLSSELPVDLVETRLRSNYMQAQYVFVQFLTEHLAECSRAFDGDLVEVLVLAIIGQAALQGASGGGAFKSVNATRISDLIGIPRQTVRRKLLKLEDRGWIAQDPNAGWRLAQGAELPAAKVSLKKLDESGIRRLAQLYVGIDAICKNPAPSSAPTPQKLPPSLTPVPPNGRS